MLLVLVGFFVVAVVDGHGDGAEVGERGARRSVLRLLRLEASDMEGRWLSLLLGGLGKGCRGEQ